MTNMDDQNPEEILPENGGVFEEDDDFLPASPDEIGLDLFRHQARTPKQPTTPPVSPIEQLDDSDQSQPFPDPPLIPAEQVKDGLTPSTEGEILASDDPNFPTPVSAVDSEQADFEDDPLKISIDTSEEDAPPRPELVLQADDSHESDPEELETPDTLTTLPLPKPKQSSDEAAFTRDDNAPISEQETDIAAAAPPTNGKFPKRKRFRWLAPTLLGLLALALIAVISAFGGYRSGIDIREAAAGTQAAQLVQEQYILGVQDLEQGLYFRARQRFEYVINLDPEFPGAQEKLAETLYHLNTTATPTLLPTATLTPTPDLRGVQELFDQATQYLDNGDWNNAIETLLSLRQTDPSYRMVEVDGMLFLALRNRGRDKIVKEADLEGGIYDLTLAERFGLLDSEAQGLLTWTSLYITGASFWKIDWEQAAYYFGQVAANLPNLMDKSGLTAGQRYRTALIEYGFQLADQKQWCKSAEQFQLALELGYDAETENNFNIAAQRCEQQRNPQQPQPTPEGP